VTPASDGRQGDPPPAPSSLVALEVALLSSAEHGAPSDAAVALVVASDDDERTYVADALRQRADFLVVAVATVPAALEAAAHRTPRVLVATHDARGVVRHLPAVAAVLQLVESRLEGNGRLLVRYSGTEPLLRVMLEGRDQVEIRKWGQEIIDAVKQHVGAA